MNAQRTVQIIRPSSELSTEDQKIKAAAYCRVSTDSDDQENSFLAQVKYYSDYIGSREDMILVDIYADEGITGTAMSKREEFKRLLSDAKLGRIDRVFCKSVSRFARNSLECIESIRALKDCGTTVVFENDNIDTKTMNSEMVLYVKSAFAQSEALAGSARVSSAYRMKMENGTFTTYCAPFGYRLVNGNLEIIPEEAEIVRKIFNMYLSGLGINSISAKLNREAIEGTLGFDDVAFTENMATGKHIINGVASAADYESAADTVIATFKCKVDAGATGTLEVGLTELEFASCKTFEVITSRFSVVKTAVAISGATPPPATYTVSFNANGGTGTMAEVTGVSAGAYTLPANGFTAPDGKRFVGWATSAGGTATAAGGTITVSANVTLYAIWEEIPTSHPAKPTLGITGTYTYSDSAQTVTVTGFDSATMLITGNVGTNAGTYTASVTSKSGRWADGTSTPITIEWSIGRKTVTPVIRVSGTYTYTGTPVEPTFTIEDGGVVISTSEYARTITDNDAVGTGKITVSDKTGGNYEILTTSQTFEISAPTPPPMVYTSTEIKITADKTDAKAGDEITFTITMGPVSELGSIQMKLKLPAGLTVVAGSCRLATGLKATLGFDDISFTEGTDYVITGVASAANYRSDADTVIATFKCKVDTSAPGNLKADLKELEFYSVDFINNTSRFRVAPATITVADSRTKVSEVAGTSDISTILVYGGAYKKPTVNVTTGAPAYFNINSGNGKWLKKNSAGAWERYTGATFTEGTYMFDCQVRIDDAAGLTHMLDSAGVTVTVDGAAWTTGTPEVYDDYSLVGVSSPEYTVTSPSATTYTVTVTAGANMTTTGSATQNVNIGDAMAEIICTAADGYYFPTDYTVAAVNGITVTRIDFTKIKVSGTPTAAANITLTAPTAKTKEATPTAVFTANGTDSGKLAGIAAGMKYRINGGAWMNITATEANLTGLSACTITIMKSGNGTTTIDSDEQTITVTKAAKPALTPTLLTLTGGKGRIPTTAAHEFSTDGAAWTPCTGATENLDTGKYYVRVKANGTQLASETQEIDIFLYGDVNGDGKVDIDDLTRLRRYNAEASTVIFPGADANGDGTVDIYDLTRLRKYFAEEAVVLGK